MELLALWIVTSITSLGMELVNEMRLFKDVADAGYKINMDRISEIGKQLDSNVSQNTLLSMLIPIFNMMQALQRTITYNNIRPMFLDQLSAIDALEKMSEAEKTEYLKNPTGLNAVAISLSSGKTPNDTLKEDAKNEEENTSSMPQDLIIRDQNQALEDLESELLEEKEVIQSTQIDKGPILAKRRK